MPNDVLPPEEIARHACKIARSLEGMSAQEARLIIESARAYVELAGGERVQFTPSAAS